jgi:hypothetical protein
MHIMLAVFLYRHLSHGARLLRSFSFVHGELDGRTPRGTSSYMISSIAHTCVITRFVYAYEFLNFCRMIVWVFLRGGGRH